MRLILSAACLAVMPAAASATAPTAAGTTAPALPDPVRAMVEAAAHTGDKAKIDVVVAFAKLTIRGAEAVIDRFVADIAAIRAAELQAKLAEAEKAEAVRAARADEREKAKKAAEKTEDAK